jgi:hypothetical protein
MNKFSTAVSLAALSLTLSSCGMFGDDPYVGGDFAKLVQKEQEWSDTVKVVDSWGIEDSYDERIYSHKPENFYFEASGSINEINIDMRVECDDDGGKMTVSCLRYRRDGIWHYGPDIVFSDLDGNKMTSSDGYTVRMLDSLTVGKKTYKDVLEFDATGAEENSCNFDKFYVAAQDGLLRIDLQGTITIERKP